MVEVGAGAIRRSLLVFVDGVGIGAEDAARNPFLTASMPTLDRLLGGRPHEGTPSLGSAEGAAACVPLDACLGVEGLPQSGTGQAALLTGTNAPRAFGRHFGPWTPVALRPVVAAGNLLTVARADGRTVAFANAYPEELVAAADDPRPPAPLRAATVIAARGAGALVRGTPELARGSAVASEITNGGWREHLRRTEVPEIDAAAAGANLAAIAGAHDLTLFAHYSTDTAGHTGDADRAIAALERLDAFLDGLVRGSPADLRIVVASDHGNIEDLSAGHTRHPALGLVLGPGAAAFAGGLRSILDVAPAMLAELGVRPPGPRDAGPG
ncbi:MAG TPA: alkaline phosphatase family protein [Longimicrobiales bacterium]|nr:alkaline phosphatase family protein [Longimicrobiales bacterium]